MIKSSWKLAGAALATCLAAGCASKTLPPDSLILQGVAPYLSVRANIDAQTAVLHAHKIPQGEGRPDRHDVEVMSFISDRPLPSEDFDLAKRFVRLKCVGITEDQIDQSVIHAGPGGYYRFTNLPCELEVKPLFRSARQGA